MIDKARKQGKSMAIAYKEALEYIQDNPIKDYIEGEDRVLGGYKMQFVSRDGKYKCKDMDIPVTGKGTGGYQYNQGACCQWYKVCCRIIMFGGSSVLPLFLLSKGIGLPLKNKTLNNLHIKG